MANGGVKGISTGVLLYMITVTVLLIYFVGQWERQRERGNQGFGNLYAVCRSVEVAAAHLLEQKSPGLSAEGLMERMMNPVTRAQSTIQRVCKSDNGMIIDEFERIKRREERHRKRAEGAR